MSTLADQFREILVYINEYFMIPMFILGVMGNMANIIIFCQSRMRKNGCSLYFISVSLIHLFVLIFGCLPRIISTLTGFDLINSSLLFCKVRIYFFPGGICLSRYYLCLISIDRWMITSLNARTRRRSNLQTTRRVILISTIIWLLFNLHLPIGFDLQSGGCTTSNGFYLIFYLVINLIVSIVPFIVMISFATLTLQRVMKKGLLGKHGQAIHPVELVEKNVLPITRNTNNQHEQISNKNLQLIRLNLIQVVFFILLNFPNTVYTVYSSITRTYSKNNDQKAIDGFFNIMTSNLLNTYCAISFFLYTLASVAFRKECWITCHCIQQHIFAFVRRQ